MYFTLVYKGTKMLQVINTFKTKINEHNFLELDKFL